MLNLQKCGVNCKTENDDLFIYPSKNYQINSNIIQQILITELQWLFVLWRQK